VGDRPGEGVSSGEGLVLSRVGVDVSRMACSCGTSVGIVGIIVGVAMREDAVAPGAEIGERVQAARAMIKELVIKALRIRMNAFTAR
jgi:hypothetical protein